MIDLEQLKADRKAGTEGPWEISHQNGDPEGSFHGIIGPVQTNRHGGQFTVYACQFVLPKNARRIARLPELEAAYIEVVAKLDKAVEALTSPSIELIDTCQEAANDYCEIDGDRGAWITSAGVEAILKIVSDAMNDMNPSAKSERDE